MTNRVSTNKGAFGIRDPPRDSARVAVSTCQRAGIRVIMITGDQQPTGMAIGKDLGICRTDDECSGLSIRSASIIDTSHYYFGLVLGCTYADLCK